MLLKKKHLAWIRTQKFGEGWKLIPMVSAQRVGDGEAELVSAVYRQALLLRPDHARHALDVLALLLELLDRVRREGVLPQVQTLQVPQQGASASRDACSLLFQE